MNRSKIHPWLLTVNFILFLFLIWGNRQIDQITHEKKAGSPVRTSRPPLRPFNQVLSVEDPRSLRLNHMFDDRSEADDYPREKIRTLVATGDVMFGRAVNARSIKEKKFQWPFEKTADILKEGDLTLVNLEGPLISTCPVTAEGMKFCADPAHVDGLKLAGVDVVNLANNHLLDYGPTGLEATKETLKINGLTTSGWGESAFQNVRGLSFGFLSFCPACGGEDVFKGAGQERLALEIEAVGKGADIVVVSFHWGEEYRATPTEEQRQLARLAIDNGADLVIGHHPHWVQPVEIYKGKLIVYSLGNFVFDQMWSSETRVGLVGRFTFLNDQLIDAQFFPVKTENLGQPEWQSGEEKKMFLDDLENRSLLFAG